MLQKPTVAINTRKCCVHFSTRLLCHSFVNISDICSWLRMSLNFQTSAEDILFFAKYWRQNVKKHITNFLSIQIFTLLTSTYLLIINFKQCCRLKFVNNIVQTMAVEKFVVKKFFFPKIQNLLPKSPWLKLFGGKIKRLSTSYIFWPGKFAMSIKNANLCPII